MKLSILFFLVLSALSGTLVMAPMPPDCDRGYLYPFETICLCEPGYAGADPSKNRLVTYYDEKKKKVYIVRLETPDPCDTPCDWWPFLDPNANYSCITKN